jgi:hypothetical protein
VGKLLNDDTIRHYFIQRLSMPFIIRDILNMRPTILEATIFAALKVEVINKKMIGCFKGWKNPFLHSYLFYHHLNEFPRCPTMDYHHGIVPQIPLMQPTPFTMLSPLELIQMVVPFMDRQWEEFKVEIKQSNDNFKDEMVRTMQGISEQMSCLVKNQNKNVVRCTLNLVLICWPYGAPIVNNQITLLNFAQFYYNNHPNPC